LSAETVNELNDSLMMNRGKEWTLPSLKRVWNKNKIHFQVKTSGKTTGKLHVSLKKQPRKVAAGSRTSTRMTKQIRYTDFVSDMRSALSKSNSNSDSYSDDE